jgi:hypothetical protein
MEKVQKKETSHLQATQAAEGHRSPALRVIKAGIPSFRPFALTTGVLWRRLVRDWLLSDMRLETPSSWFPFRRCRCRSVSFGRYIHNGGRKKRPRARDTRPCCRRWVLKCDGGGRKKDQGLEPPCCGGRNWKQLLLKWKKEDKTHPVVASSESSPSHVWSSSLVAVPLWRAVAEDRQKTKETSWRISMIHSIGDR